MNNPLNELLNNLANLFKVKTIISLTMIFGITYGFVTNMVSVELYASFVASIITYFFTKKE